MGRQVVAFAELPGVALHAGKGERKAFGNVALCLPGLQGFYHPLAKIKRGTQDDTRPGLQYWGKGL